MTRNHYSLDYREQIVAMVQSGRSIGSVATEFGLTDQTVRNWLKKVQDGTIVVAKRVCMLRRALAWVKDERDILAKATAWFATETPRRSSSHICAPSRLYLRSVPCVAVVVIVRASRLELLWSYAIKPVMNFVRSDPVPLRVNLSKDKFTQFGVARELPESPTRLLITMIGLVPRERTVAMETQ